MQSDVGRELIRAHGAEVVGIDTFLLIKDGRCYERTDAALEIAQDLTGFWRLLRILRILPRPVRDYFYRLFARNRYVLFGKRESCMIPTTGIVDRFLK